MKRILMMSFGVAVVLAMTLPLQAANARGKTELALNGKNVSIDYGRPVLHGRTVGEMLSKLKPGQVWRLGADSSTTFESDTDLEFGSKTVPAGTYSLWAEKLSGNRWDLVFNKQHGQWGTQHDPKLDLVKVPLHESKASDSAEMVTINLAQHESGGHFSVQWGDLVLATNFSAK
ncbi:MAG TPA: DUF2911 domain-containing protein [Terriglobia bacterium]|nr:DUF2911 domain-containing protein [Terriglobia bacterium]